MQPKHYATLGILLCAIALLIGGLDHWADAIKPQFVAGVVAAIGAVLKGMYEEKPGDGAPAVTPSTLGKLPTQLPAVVLAVGLGAAGLTLTGCAGNKAPSVTPAPVLSAVKAAEVVHALDAARDVAKVVSDAYPNVITAKDFQTILTFHESAVAVIGAAPNGWKPTVEAGLDQLQKDLSPAAAARIGPYLALVRTLVAAFVPAGSL